ncbi:MAG TPA: hypothetical protein VLA09_10915 [Longimicrobiales bacterium]|nr:hypothetical protein [Longimicrobiales bacterium]
MKATCPSWFVAAVMALATVGCQETPISPAAADLEPSFNFSNGPDSPGNSGVIRFEGAFGFLSWEESEGGLFAFHFENADLPICGGSGLDPTGDVQIVATTAGLLRDIIQVPDTPISIYSAAVVLPIIFGQIPPDEGCQILADDWLYRGTHTMTVTGLIGAGQSFGWSGYGDVWDPDGNQFNYTETARIVGFEEKLFDIEVRPRGKN